MTQETVFFEGLIQASRKLKMDYDETTEDAPESAAQVRRVAADFLERYAAFNRISQEAAVASYMETMRRYVRDIRVFQATGKYPLQIDPQQGELGRTDYDLILILSILVTRHRCAMMEEIMQISIPGRALVIGVGSGVELGFIQAPDGGDAYDLHINSFARQAFPQWNFHEKLYRPNGQRYAVVYAIELLEHLDEPYDFVADCHRSLLPGGRLVTTTAADMPQFDHRYNFVSDEEFEQRVRGLGFEVESKRILPHQCAQMDINSRNVFYVLRRNT